MSYADSYRTSLILAALLVFGSGCREDAQSPSAPAPDAALGVTAAAALSFRQITTGYSHACGVTTDDRAYCWGYNTWGQLGNGTQNGPNECNTHPCSNRPVAVSGNLRFKHLSAGDGHTCGLTTTDDRIYCWGLNEHGQLGNGTTDGSNTPVPVPGARRFRQVRAGGAHSCALTMADFGFCWGANNFGQLGDGTKTQRLTPVLVGVGLSWRQLSGGSIHTCGVTTASAAYCWGHNAGALGDGTRTDRVRPSQVSSGRLFKQIEAGFSHTCAVAGTENRGYCWGSAGQALGNGTTQVRLVPTALAGNRKFAIVNAAFVHSCGVTLVGRGFCWGSNQVGQVGDGTTGNTRLKPTEVVGAVQWAGITGGTGFSCGVTTDHRGFCWGDNFYGQLGDGTTTGHSSPRPVSGPI